MFTRQFLPIIEVVFLRPCFAATKAVNNLHGALKTPCRIFTMLYREIKTSGKPWGSIDLKWCTQGHSIALGVGLFDPRFNGMKQPQPVCARLACMA